MQYIEDNLDPKRADVARAIKSLQEELEAVNFYHQRAGVVSDPELKAIIEHNRDEEIEHSCMLFEWLRRNMGSWDADMKKYLFTSGSLTEIEDSGDAGACGDNGSGDLGIRNLERR